ncbi:oligoendopeptidase F [Alicyclobacillus fodiniaquatilis]|uniref:Oligopeptidase F n=1 Tax=Alicyclobacillus fodiniaquatilis TaxID=1661150 RepID=A0ABW4JBM2_9BACL
MGTRFTRSEVPVEMTWNLADLFPSVEAWETALAEVAEQASTVTAYKGRLGEGASALLDCLSAHEALQMRIVRVATYASLRANEDGTNPLNQANSMRLGATISQVREALSFMDSEILALPDGTVERYLAEEPSLQAFGRFLDDLLAYKPHMLSEETERALAALGEVFGAPHTIYQRSKLSDMQFAPIEDPESGDMLPVSFALYEDQYELTANTEIRHKAYDSFVNTLRQYQHGIAATYATEVKKQVVQARLRKYESVTHMLLQPQHVTIEMYNNQLDIIQNELAVHMRKFAQLKQRLLGLPQMRHCDLKVPIDGGFNPATTFAEASNVILEALSILGPEYTAIIETALAERWVDLADNVGKATGAFCSSPYGVHPYILMTWTDNMRGAFILAHELGHAGHFGLANRYQRIMNTRPSTYFIEAPSTMNELILGQHILDKSEDPQMRRWVITQFLNTYYHNFVTHLLEGELQRRVYSLAEAGKPITANVLCEQKGELLRNFWGDTVEIDEGATLTWMRQPHYYMGLYPYTYSAGLTASTAIAQLIREEGQPAVDRWLDVLKAGGTLEPLELMKMAGVDMTTPDPIRKAVAYVGSLVDELVQSFA